MASMYEINEVCKYKKTATATIIRNVAMCSRVPDPEAMQTKPISNQEQEYQDIKFPLLSKYPLFR